MINIRKDKRESEHIVEKIKKDYFKDVGFLYEFWYEVFIAIEGILPFNIIRKGVFKNTKNFSDKWVLFNLILSIVSIF